MARGRPLDEPDAVVSTELGADNGGLHIANPLGSITLRAALADARDVSYEVVGLFGGGSHVDAGFATGRGRHVEILAAAARDRKAALNPYKVLPRSRPHSSGAVIANSTGRLMGTEATERLLMVGLSHAEAPLSLLERVVVSRDELPEILLALRAAGFPEAAVLSTCSRS